MKNSQRVLVSQHNGAQSIEIIPQRDSLKTKLLLIWLTVWTFCGIIVFSQFFSNMSREEKLMMAVWMAFWAYFEFKISTAYTWRKSGSEKIEIDSENLILSQVVSGKSISKTYNLDNISNLEVYEFGKNSFSESFQSSYWVKGNETVFFSHFSEKVGMGLQLNKEEANQLFQTINKVLKKRK